MTNKPQSIPACIVLAAGSSSRFGSAKLQHKLPSGLTVLQQTLNQYLKVFDQLTVVIREGDKAFLEQIKHKGVHSIVCSKASLGMSQSLVCGIQAQQSASAWMIALGDMPYLKSATIEALSRASNPSSIAQLVDSGKPGNPVVFGRDFYADLIALKGDKGGKELIERYTEKLIKVDVDDPGIFQDIDQPCDVRKR